MLGFSGHSGKCPDVRHYRSLFPTRLAELIGSQFAASLNSNVEPDVKPERARRRTYFRVQPWGVADRNRSRND
jgi:hypothetical protein